jgi:hypothetical protein
MGSLRSVSDRPNPPSLHYLINQSLHRYHRFRGFGFHFGELETDDNACHLNQIAQLVLLVRRQPFRDRLDAGRGKLFHVDNGFVRNVSRLI